MAKVTEGQPMNHKPRVFTCVMRSLRLFESYNFEKIFNNNLHKISYNFF